MHRLDGPYYASRYGLDPALFDKAKGDKNFKEDEGVYAINKEFACASIFQSKVRPRGQVVGPEGMERRGRSADQLCLHAVAEHATPAKSGQLQSPESQVIGQSQLDSGVYED